MKTEERRGAIARYIAEHGEVDIQTLADHFGVSSMTIRRDRQILVKQHKIAGTHGGAVSVGYKYSEPSYNNKISVNLVKKQAIARAAATLVPDNSCIILDAGTTMLELAKLLFHKNLSIITIDLHIALYLAQSSTVKVFTPGGEVDRDMQGQLDINALHYLEKINPSLSFIGSAVWDPQKGVSSSTVAKQAIKKTLIKQAEKSILLVDSTKFGLCNPWSVAALNEFSAIVTDNEISEENRKMLSAVGENLMIARQKSASHISFVS